MNFVRGFVKGVRPHSCCVSKACHMRALCHVADVFRCEVSDILVGLSYKNGAFYLFLSVFPEYELSEVFLRVCMPWSEIFKVFWGCVFT